LKTQLAPPFKLDLNPVLLNIGRGDLFGEDSFFFSRSCTYTLTVASASAVILSLSKEDFHRAYPKLFRHEPLKYFFDARKTLSADLEANSIPINL
jgi:CRP-like cAMP-binding protein